MSFGAVCFCSYACESSYSVLSEVSLNVCFMLFLYLCIYRDAQSGSHGRWDVVAGQHQSNRLLQSELRPSQLETSYSTAEDQPNGRLSSTSVSPSSFLFEYFLWVFFSLFCHDPSFSSFSSSLLSLLHGSCCIINVSACSPPADHLCGQQGRSDWWRLQPGEVGSVCYTQSHSEPETCSTDPFNILHTPTETRWTIQTNSALFVCCFLLSLQLSHYFRSSFTYQWGKTLGV